MQQAEGPGGVKLYSIKIKQKNPSLRRNERIKDSIEASPFRQETLNVTRLWHGDHYEEPSSPDLHSRMQLVARGADLMSPRATEMSIN